MVGEAQPTILLVEDEAIIAMAETVTLKRNGYSVYTAYSGHDAIQTVTEHPSIDLVLIDVDLGSGMDGPQTAAAILGNKNIPILFLSNHTEPEVVARTERIASSGYVVKNSGETVLLASIRMAFKLHAAQLQAQTKARQLELMNEELSRAIKELGATNRKLEEALRRSETEFRSLFEASPVAVGMLVDRRFRKVNSVMCETFGYSEAEMLGESTRMLYEDEEEYARVGRELYRALHAERCVTIESRLRKKDGSAIDVRISASSLDPASPDDPAEIATTVQDITEQKRAEAALRSTEHSLQRAQEIGGVGSFVLELTDRDPARQTWRSTATMDELFGIDANFPRTGESWLGLIVQRDEVGDYFLRRVFGARQRFEKEYQIVRPLDGETRWISGRGELEFDAGGIPIRMIGTVQDITEQKKTSRLLGQSLHDKDIIFQELCHRVKNSLTMIMSIINIEMDQADAEARKSLVSLNDRISSIEKLYELLYHSGTGGTIRLDEYIGAIIESLRDAYVRGETIRIDQRLQSLRCGPKGATTLGIIVNELVANALKHAFPDGGRGNVLVALDASEEELVLSVSDDGPSLPDTFDAGRSPGLGLRLVDMLSQQLGGSLSLERGENKSFVVRVSLKNIIT